MAVNNYPPRLVLTAGEPAGIGPDLCVLLAQRPHPADIIVATAPELLEQRARLLRLPLQLELFDSVAVPTSQTAGRLRVLPVSLAAPAYPGRLDLANARHVLTALESAARGCLEGIFSALVTGPVHKGVINDSGITFFGHTSYLARLCGVPVPVMMLVAPGLRVALVTTHLPLRAVPDAITPERLEAVIRILDRDLRTRFAIPAPRILVSGLNPHAGEDGYLGHEEEEIIKPSLERLRREGLRLQGPLPADTLFIPHYLENADVVLAMYHDQGLPVLKHKGFGKAVNITLGLPLLRTSVDHGTALELAGTGRVNLGSLEAAVAAALDMVRVTRANRPGHA
ncbi:MAG: 4-hydroxythreonine-4-phosphate dehydrogenase PdxA [Candidatus Competibacteraceae bacterium]